MSEKKPVGHPFAAIPECILSLICLLGTLNFYFEAPDGFRFTLIAICAAFLGKSVFKIVLRYKARKDEHYGYSSELLYLIATVVFMAMSFVYSIKSMLTDFGWFMLFIACVCGLLSLCAVVEAIKGLKSPKKFEEKLQVEKAAKLAAKRMKKEANSKAQHGSVIIDPDAFGNDLLDYDPDTGEVYNYDDHSSRRGKNKKQILSNWEQTLDSIWNGSEKVQFSYLSNKGERTRRSVILESVQIGNNGNIYFRGFCELRNEVRTFEASRITSKILYRRNNKKYFVDEFMQNVLGV